jgi:hypothetical protein
MSWLSRGCVLVISWLCHSFLKGGGISRAYLKKNFFSSETHLLGVKKCEKHENRKIKIPSHDQTTQTDMPYVKKQHYGTPLCIYTSENFYNKFLSKKSIFSINFLLDFFIFLLDFSIFCCFSSKNDVFW